jgi:hypothetical protein
LRIVNWDGDLDHVLTEECHPGRAVGLLQVAAGRQRRAPVEHADVVEPQESALERVVAARSLRFTHQVKLSVSL